MDLIIFHAKRRWYCVLIAPIIICFFLMYQKNERLFANVGGLEITIAAMIGFICSFTISNPAELELCKCYGFAPSRIMTAQILPAYISGLIGCGVVAYAYRYFMQVTFTHERVLLAVSAVISLTFMMAANALLRVLARNTYIVAFLDLVILHFPMYAYHDQFRFIKEYTPRVIFDFAISGVTFDKGFFNVPMVWWTVNRVAVLVLAVVFYIAACRLADRRNFEDLK